MAERKRDSLRKPEEQYSLFKFIFRFAVKTGNNRNQLTRYSYDFDSERQKFLPGLDVASRRIWRSLLNSDPIVNEPSLYETLAKFRPHYNANENKLLIWFPPSHYTHFKTIWETFQVNVRESIELLNLNGILPAIMNEEQNPRQIRLLEHSVQDEKFQTFNGYQRLALYFSPAIQRGEIVGIDIFDNLNYTPDNHLMLLDINNLPGLPKDVDEKPQHDLKSRTGETQPAGKLIENAFGKVG